MNVSLKQPPRAVRQICSVSDDDMGIDAGQKLLLTQQVCAAYNDAGTLPHDDDDDMYLVRLGIISYNSINTQTKTSPA